MKITDVHISPISESRGLVAFASITLDESIKLSGIAIHRKKDESGYRLTYPTKRVKGSDRYIFCPLHPKWSHEIEDCVIDAYLEICNTKDCNAGYRGATYTDQ